MVLPLCLNRPVLCSINRARLQENMPGILRMGNDQDTCRVRKPAIVTQSSTPQFVLIAEMLPDKHNIKRSLSSICLSKAR